MRVVEAQGRQGQGPEQVERRQGRKGRDEGAVLHVGPHVVVFPVVFVTANQGQGRDVRAHLAQPDQRFRAERAIKQMHLTQPRAVVAHVQQHALHLVRRAEVLQCHARHELEPEADGLHHGHVGAFVAVAEV